MEVPVKCVLFLHFLPLTNFKQSIEIMGPAMAMGCEL